MKPLYIESEGDVSPAIILDNEKIFSQ